jgi:hypothetical protein
MEYKNFSPGRDLYYLVRQGFVGQRTSLNRWCITHGVTRQLAEAALKGMYDGPKSRALRARIIEAAKVDIEAIDHPVTAQSKVG